MTATFADLMLDIPATNQALLAMHSAGDITADEANAKLAMSCFQNALCAYNALAAERDDLEVVDVKDGSYSPDALWVEASLTDPADADKAATVIIDLETSVAEHFYDVAASAAALRGKALNETDVFGSENAPAAYVPVIIG